MQIRAVRFLQRDVIRVYKAFFGFQKDPFASTPDPAFFFRSSHHDAALKGLLLSVEARLGAISLMGDKGTGKTVVLECLRNSLGPDISCAFLRDSRISFDRLLETIASDLDLDLRFEKKSAPHVFLALTRLMTQQARRGSTVVLIVDEAENLSPDVFNDIVHIASLHHDKVKEIQTVFAGRPELQPRLAALNPYKVNQRAFLIRSLYPFTARETQEYVEFRMACAGVRKQTIFPREVLDAIHDHSQGLAPAIHTLCEKLLLTAFSVRSNVCTREIRDQVFKKPSSKLAKIVENVRTVAAVRIEQPRLVPPPLPEPPPMHTALLRVAVDARLGSLRPRLAITDERPVPLEVIALRIAFPSARFAFGGTGLALRPIRPMPIKECTRASVLRRSVGLGPAISFIPLSGPVTSLPKAATGEARKPGPLQLPAGELISSERYISLGPPLTGAPSYTLPFLDLLARNLHPVFPTTSLQPVSIIPCSRVPFPVIRTTKNSDRLTSTLTNAESYPVPFSTVPQPICPAASLQAASITPCSRIPLPPIRATKYDRLTSATASADAFPVPFSTVPQPIQPLASLQPASPIPSSRLPFKPFTTTRHAPLPVSASQSAEIEPVDLIPDERSTVRALSTSFQLSARQPNISLPLPLSVPPAPPSAETPIHSFLSPQLSLQARRPMSGLNPADPPRPSLLPTSTWMQRDASPKVLSALAADTFAGLRKPPASHRNLLLTFVVPILAAVALYGASPAMRAAADASKQGWQRAKQAVLNRAAVALDEDFQAGLSNWTNRGGSPPRWATDAATFVRPGALALYRPSLGMADYQMQFFGTIDKNDLSWVVRAADFNNYYVVRLVVLKPGPLPTIGLTRYAVVHGIPQKRVTKPMPMRAQADTVYRVRLDVQGDQFALLVQDQPVDSWSEPRLGHGAIGFFSDKDAGSRIARLQLRGRYDLLGRICAFLIPSAISNDR